MFRLWRASGGATAVEMAFLLPVFLLFMLGIEEFGRALWLQTSLQFAVEAAARCAAVSPSLCTAPGGSTTDVPAYTASQVFAFTLPSSTFTYTPNATCGAPSSTGGGAQVETTSPGYLFRPAVDLSGLVSLVTHVSGGTNPLSNIRLNAKSCHP